LRANEVCVFSTVNPARRGKKTFPKQNGKSMKNAVMIGSPDTGVTYKTGRMQDSATCI
jgi:hypothetical protein